MTAADPSLLARRERLLPLEGLRGVAACVVLLQHIVLTFYVDLLDQVHSSIGKVPSTMIAGLFDGHFAVYVFWVLSAFVLCLAFHREHHLPTARKRLLISALGRYPRLVIPVFASVLLAWVIHAGGAMSNTQLAELLGPQYRRWLGSFYQFDASFTEAVKGALWETFFQYKLESTYNPVLWTMEKELFGSLFLFALLAVVGKWAGRVLIYGFCAAVFYVLKLHWLNAFVGGIVLCDGYVNAAQLMSRVPPDWRQVLARARYRQLWGWVAFLPLVYCIGLPDYHGVFHLLLACWVTVLVMVYVPFSRLLSSNCAVFLGKISFGLYLAHLPIICSAALPTFNTLRVLLDPPLARFVTCIALVLLSIVCGWLLWLLVDRHATFAAKRLANRIHGSWLLTLIRKPTRV